MSSYIQFHDVMVATATSAIPTRYVDKYDQLLFRVPSVEGVFSSSPVVVTLLGAPSANQTVQQVHYFDYVNKTPATSVITVSTGGVYEMPYPGAQQFISLQFDVPTSNVTNFQISLPKTTY